MAEKKRSTRVAADPEKWSKSSKQSMEYLFGRDEYVDIHYLCWRCGAAAIYPAEDQRIDYEVLKAYIWRRRLLCSDCWRQRKEIESRIRERSAQWQVSKRTLRRDVEFLSAWLQDLLALSGYGGKSNSARIGMLRKLLREHGVVRE